MKHELNLDSILNYFSIVHLKVSAFFSASEIPVTPLPFACAIKDKEAAVIIAKELILNGSPLKACGDRLRE